MSGTAPPVGKTSRPADPRAAVERGRRSLLVRLSALLDKPMTALSFVWLGLMIVEFAGGGGAAFERLGMAIWSLFVVQFLVEFWIAPRKGRYLREHWLTALALLLPAFRMLRMFRAFRWLRAARVGRGLGLARWLASLNRGLKATRKAMRRRGWGYVATLTLLVDLAGAAGVYHFENPQALGAAGHAEAANGIADYGDALWWTSMMLTTMGSDYFPRTTEGRVLALLLAVYAFAIFGYLTASVATAILRVDGPDEPRSLALELAALKAEVAALRSAIEGGGGRGTSPER